MLELRALDSYMLSFHSQRFCNQNYCHRCALIAHRQRLFMSVENTFCLPSFINSFSHRMLALRAKEELLHPTNPHVASLHLAQKMLIHALCGFFARYSWLPTCISALLPAPHGPICSTMLLIEACAIVSALKTRDGYALTP